MIFMRMDEIFWFANRPDGLSGSGQVRGIWAEGDDTRAIG
jgi:hypothetical protein